MKKIYIVFLLLILVSILFGCKNKKRNNQNGVVENPNITENPTTTPEITPEIPEEEKHDGEMRSFLTGEWIEEEKGKMRPYAIQFSNYKTVRNQWGIAEADILYEAMVEGGITRIMGISQNFKGDRIGSVRSARHYYVSFLELYDAIYIHFGKTKYATSKFKELGTDNMDGTTGVGNTVFYRVTDLKAPHNAFTSLEKIKKGIEQKGFETELKKDYKGLYQFYKEDTDLVGGQNADKVTIKYFSYNKPKFEYNSKDKMYYRFQFDEPHIDSATKEQLKFKNIIIQFVKEWNIDRNGYQTMDIEDAKGEGYYISNGKIINITWKMNEKSNFICYYNESGEVLNLNQGKTFFVLYPDNKVKDLMIE